jgi:hypothetical protein
MRTDLCCREQRLGITAGSFDAFRLDILLLHFNEFTLIFTKARLFRSPDCGFCTDC